MSGSANSHARLSPSSSKRWTTCTASIGYIEANTHRIPGDGSSRYSDEGTEAHDWAEKVLNGEIEDSEVPEHFAPALEYVAHCRTLIEENPHSESFIEYEAALFYETEPVEKERNGETVMALPSGTVDFALITEEKIIIRDLKYGAGVLVEAEGNTQLAIYAMSIIKELQDEGFYSFAPDTAISLGIVQPRYRGDEPVKTWELSLAELEHFCEEITEAAAATYTLPELPDDFPPVPWGTTYIGEVEWSRIKDLKEDTEIEGLFVTNGEDWVPTDELDAGYYALVWNSPIIPILFPGLKFEPSEDACRWCPAKGFCAARARELSEAFEPEGIDVLADLPDLSKEDKKLPIVERIGKLLPHIGAELEDETLVAIYAKEKAIRAFLSDIGDYLEERALAGDPAEGTKLVLGRAGNSAWTDEEAAEKLIRQELKLEERTNRKLISPTQAREKLKEVLENRTRFRNLFESLVTRSEGKKVLALASDKRPAVESVIDDLPMLEEG